MNLSVYRAKKPAAKAVAAREREQKSQSKMPKLEDFIKERDYTGAIVLLEFLRATGQSNEQTLPWLGYAAFHLGDYKKALDTYNEILKSPNADPVNHLYAACCQFYLGHYKEAETEASKGPASPLQNRILFHASHRLGDETKLMTYHQKMGPSHEDQLSLASIHYLRSHFQEATDIYKKILVEFRDYLALQVYVAMCYYKLDYYDVSLEILAPYLSAYPDSAIALNLKACNHYKLYDGKAAEQELKTMIDMLSNSSSNSSSHNDSDLVRHNLVVFRNGENALQVLPPLVDIIPEARLNLVIYHLRHNEHQQAFNLLKSLEPSTPQEYILKGVVHAVVGQQQENTQYIKLAQQYFQLVGASASECDTIPGRQSMASCFFLLKQFDDVLIYLNSIKAYAYNDPVFNYNHGVALAASEQYKEAIEAFLLVTDEAIRQDYAYVSHLARCFIMTGKAREAWELYLKMESSTDSFAILVLIANECYRVGSFYYSAKAFDVLERLDPSQEHWEGKRGACVGVFQLLIAKRETKEHFRDVLLMLRNNQNTPQAELLARIMKKWAAEHHISIPA